MGQQFEMDSAGIISSLFHVEFSELTHTSQVSAGATGMADLMGYLGFSPHSLSSSRERVPRGLRPKLQSRIRLQLRSHIMSLPPYCTYQSESQDSPDSK